MTKIIIQTIQDGTEHVIAESQKILHGYEETPYDFYRSYEELIREHKKQLFLK